MSIRPMSALALVLTLAFATCAAAQSRTPAPLDRTAPPQTTIADTVPPPPGVPNIAWLSSLEYAGEPPADSLRGAFMSSFRGAFAEGAYATERTRDGRPAASLPVSARFRLIEGTSGWGVWNVQVVVRPEPVAGAAHPRLHVTVAALAPDAAEAGARPIPAATTLAFEDGGALPSGALRPVAWWRMAGRTVGLLALERLHHLSGDLDDDTRFALGPAGRVEPPPADAPPVKPVPKGGARRY